MTRKNEFIIIFWRKKENLYINALPLAENPVARSFLINEFNVKLKMWNSTEYFNVRCILFFFSFSGCARMKHEQSMKKQKNVFSFHRPFAEFKILLSLCARIRRGKLFELDCVADLSSADCRRWWSASNVFYDPQKRCEQTNRQRTFYLLRPYISR